MHALHLRCRCSYKQVKFAKTVAERIFGAKPLKWVVFEILAPVCLLRAKYPTERVLVFFDFFGLSQRPFKLGQANPPEPASGLGPPGPLGLGTGQAVGTAVAQTKLCRFIHIYIYISIFVFVHV